MHQKAYVHTIIFLTNFLYSIAFHRLCVDKSQDGRKRLRFERAGHKLRLHLSKLRKMAAKMATYFAMIVALAATFN